MDEKKYTLLIVDDEPFNLDILQEHLEDEGYTIITASSGEQALDILLNDSADISSVLLDRMMPGMDGIEVLKKIKEEPRYKHVPVIMQTAAASDANVVEGLEAGAFYYLTKPFEPELVIAVVKSALSDYEGYLNSTSEEEKGDELMPLINELTLSFKTIDEAHFVVGRVAKILPDPDRVILGLSELTVNAVEHGNLEISYEEKSALLETDSWKSEIEKRLQKDAYKDREVKLRVSKNNEEVTFVIEDEGSGFDWKSFVDINAARAYDAHGRGIAMASMVSFDSLSYNDKGNIATCIVKI